MSCGKGKGGEEEGRREAKAADEQAFYERLAARTSTAVERLRFLRKREPPPPPHVTYHTISQHSDTLTTDNRGCMQSGIFVQLSDTTVQPRGWTKGGTLPLGIPSR